MTTPKRCPKCDVCFDDGDIYEYFLNKYGEAKEAKEAASCYGWKEEERKCFSRCIALYSPTKDRTTHWMCPDCKHMWDRDLT